MDGAVDLTVRRDLVVISVERPFQEVHQVSFDFFLRVNALDLLVEDAELLFEYLEIRLVHRELLVGLVQGSGY